MIVKTRDEVRQELASIVALLREAVEVGEQLNIDLSVPPEVNGKVGYERHSVQ